jgi:DNA (cytosine-5)-methyltransferase 1
MSAPRKYRAFDLFCGGGGSSIGALGAGVQPVGGVDLWPLATSAYALNVPGAITFTRDLNELEPQKVLDEVGPIDLLLASPECTHHSVAKGNKPRCEESKQLAFQVQRFATVLKPRWLIVENVIQMRTWPSFGNWCQSLADLGYRLIVRKLDAVNLGASHRAI